MSRILLAPVESLEAHGAAITLQAAGLDVTTVAEPDVALVVVFATPGADPEVPYADGVARPVVLVAAPADPHTTATARRLDAAAVVASDAPTTTLLEAVGCVLGGEDWAEEGPAATHDDPLRDLTDRERQIVHLLGQGATNKAISTALGISYHTARTHVAHVLAKLEVTHRYAVVPIARGRDDLVAARSVAR